MSVWHEMHVPVYPVGVGELLQEVKAWREGGCVVPD